MLNNVKNYRMASYFYHRFWNFLVYSGNLVPCPPANITTFIENYIVTFKYLKIKGLILCLILPIK